MGKNNEAATVKMFTDAIGGVKKHLPASGTIVMSGQPWKQAEIVQPLQEVLDSIKAVNDARKQIEKLVERKRQSAQAGRKVYTILQKYVEGTYGLASTTAGDFGMRPVVRRKASAITKAKAVEKARETRTSRRTGGKKGGKGSTPAPGNLKPVPPPDAGETSSGA